MTGSSVPPANPARPRPARPVRAALAQGGAPRPPGLGSVSGPAEHAVLGEGQRDHGVAGAAHDHAVAGPQRSVGGGGLPVAGIAARTGKDLRAGGRARLARALALERRAGGHGELPHGDLRVAQPQGLQHLRAQPRRQERRRRQDGHAVRATDVQALLELVGERDVVGADHDRNVRIQRVTGHGGGQVHQVVIRQRQQALDAAQIGPRQGVLQVVVRDHVGPRRQTGQEPPLGTRSGVVLLRREHGHVGAALGQQASHADGEPG